MQPISEKTLLNCPTCQMGGTKQILGELKEGCLIIMRFHNHFTRIRGQFEVICDNCNDMVYFRSERSDNVQQEVFSNGEQGISWQPSLSIIGTTRV